MNFKKIKHIHFIGIGGSGMIGIARVLLKKGYKVSGSDITETHELKKLKKNGAKVYIGHDQANIKNVNLVVVSSAIDLKNSEIIEARKSSITIIPRAEMLGSLMKGYESIAIAGSHGKTTTTSMVAEICTVGLLSPTYVVGGKVLSTDENSDLGEGRYLIAEADESDGSFIHLQPDIAVLTNIDDDHLVHYDNNFENLLNSFIRFSENVPFYGYLIVNIDDKNKYIVFPNPANDVLNIQGKNVSSIKIFNIHGNIVLSKNVNNNKKVDISILNKGMYLVELEDYFGFKINKKVIIN